MRGKGFGYLEFLSFGILILGFELFGISLGQRRSYV